MASPGAPGGSSQGLEDQVLEVPSKVQLPGSSSQVHFVQLVHAGSNSVLEKEDELVDDEEEEELLRQQQLKQEQLQLQLRSDFFSINITN